MECPNCKYKQNHYNPENGNYEDDIEKLGDFYRISNNVRMVREDFDSAMRILGCPKCKMLFFDYNF